jgi:2-hydroxy-6-oxonona-2,4-dienedioate hydrolase
MLAHSQPQPSPAADFIAAQQRLLEHFGVQARSTFVDVDVLSGPAHVLASGDGPPVVMVPGFGDPAAIWVSLIAALPGFRFYAVDRPNFGLSGFADHRPGKLRQLAVTFLEQVLDALRLERATIVANSMGSLWSLWLALDRPERVAAMVHIGCPAFALGTSAPFPIRLMSVKPLSRILMGLSRPSRKQVEGFAGIVGEDLSGSPLLIDLLVAAMKMPHAQRGVRDLLNAAARLRGPRPDVAFGADHLAGVRQPVSLVWGPTDAFGGPEVGRTAASLLPDSEIHVLPAGGHIPWVQHPADVAAAARPFLEKHTRPAGGRTDPTGLLA